jgi:hypothetical protein
MATMQGRGASKASKKELVIESPQQYQSLAPGEAEPAPVPQALVSPGAPSHPTGPQGTGSVRSLEVVCVFGCLEVICGTEVLR